jgi:hypothetical protein
MPFAIVERASERVVGSTRFWKIASRPPEPP